MTTLPELLCNTDGTTITTADAWPARRKTMLDEIVDIEYGGMPPVPEWTRVETLHRGSIRHIEGARFISVRIVTGPLPAYQFYLTIAIPPGDGPFPVILHGDGCWRYATEEVEKECLTRGYILARFNRTELAPDILSTDRSTGLYPTVPEGTFGALAAWAWGYHRCVDALCEMEDVQGNQIAVVGHSRGGKTVLLAGATDERIALTAPNDSGAGGAGCHRIHGEKAEKLQNLNEKLSYWFGPKLPSYIGREAELPFDQHMLKAAIAPRAYLSTEALGDLWANPIGTWHTHQAAKPAWDLLNAPNKMGLFYREGEHNHPLEDWQTLLAFADWQFKGIAPDRDFDPPCPT